MSYILRAITGPLRQALEASPGVFLNGPRQSGKTTLVARIARDLGADYFSFDEVTALAAAEADPEGFVAGLETPVVIDEAQLVPGIFRALKLRIDALRREDPGRANGRFLLTGSANVLALPELAEALVGRTQIRTLYPLTVGETEGRAEGFIGALFAERLPRLPAADGMPDLDGLIRAATFPEISGRRWPAQERWFDAYIATILQRDVRALAQIEKVRELPNILRHLAARVGNLVNDADLARDAGLSHQTLRRYRALLEQLFLYVSVPPWYRNVGKRLAKAPKAYITDTALLCHLLGLDPGTLATSHADRAGPVLENFVATQLVRQLAHRPPFRAELHHLRTHGGVEVDFVVERPDGRLAGIEVKSRRSIDKRDFKALETVRDMVGDDFVRGVVLYRGERTVPFSPRLAAVPLSALWRLDASPI